MSLYALVQDTAYHSADRQAERNHPSVLSDSGKTTDKQ